MDIMHAMQSRHSVRRYLDTPIEGDVRTSLLREIEAVNEKSGLSVQLITNEPKAFGSIIATYGLLKNVRNYIALVGNDHENLNEAAGYYGEHLVLFAQHLGLNTCWVAGTYRKSAVLCEMNEGQRLVCVIAIGYGANQGHSHRNRPLKNLYSCTGEIPEWFEKGLHASLLAPTAVNQQRFRFTLVNEHSVRAEATGGFYSDIDLGIVKYHFEAGAGKDNFTWI